MNFTVRSLVVTQCLSIDPHQQKALNLQNLQNLRADAYRQLRTALVYQSLANNSRFLARF